MLILPPGHVQQVAARRPFSRRERVMVGSVLVAVAVLAAAVAISLTMGGRTSSNGCVEVNLPFSMGGQELYRCGDKARALCGSVGRPRSTFTGAAAQAVTDQCRKAGLPVGAAG